MNQISVIIVNYNSTPLTLQCIASVVQHVAPGYEIIVVDNHSGGQDVRDIVARFPSVQLIRMDKNAGFGNACNMAADRAKGKYLFFLNPDTLLGNDAAGAFLDFYEQHEKELPIGCLGVVLRDMEGRPVHSFERFPHAGTYLRRKLGSLVSRVSPVRKNEAESVTYISPITGYKQVDYVTGAALFISKQQFETAGGFDPAYFMYFEETDLQRRLYDQGRYSFVVSGPDIVHLGSRSAVSRAHVRVMYADSLMLYMKKYLSGFSYFLFRVVWFCLDIHTVLQRRRLGKRP